MISNKKHPVLGVLGGLGPMSSAYFYELIISHTAAYRDQDHIDMIISSRATTPDRTAFITAASDKDPLPVMIEEVTRLSDAGADILAMPCNTAHYFYDQLTVNCEIPMLNIISLTVDYARFCGSSCLGIMATDGTIKSNAYGSVCAKHGIRCVKCSDTCQEHLSDIIYKSVKQGLDPDMRLFYEASDGLIASGADRIILGCTELSLINKKHRLSDIYIDSLEVLAACTITSCGKELRDFPPALVKYASSKAFTKGITDEIK